MNFYYFLLEKSRLHSKNKIRIQENFHCRRFQPHCAFSFRVLHCAYELRIFSYGGGESRNRRCGLYDKCKSHHRRMQKSGYTGRIPHRISRTRRDVIFVQRSLFANDAPSGGDSRNGAHRKKDGFPSDSHRSRSSFRIRPIAVQLCGFYLCRKNSRARAENLSSEQRRIFRAKMVFAEKKCRTRNGIFFESTSGRPVRMRYHYLGCGR